MKLLLGKRHHCFNEASVKTLEDHVEKLSMLREIGAKHNVVPTLYYSMAGLDVSGQVRVMRAASELKYNGVNVITGDCLATSADKFLNQLIFNPQPAGTILGLCCVDQYPQYSADELEPAVDLAQKMMRDDKLYCMAYRSVPVVLGVNKKASDMRIIQELIYARAGNAPLPDAIPGWAEPLPAFIQCGEIASGFYLFNPNHAFAESIRTMVAPLVQHSARPGFGIEYATGIVCNASGETVAGFVRSEENKFYSDIDEHTETVKVKNMISHACDVIGQSKAAPHLQRVLAKPFELAGVACFYDATLVEEVASIMSENLERGMTAAR